MNDAIQQLRALALAANQHAAEHHSLELALDSEDAVDRVDRILDCERGSGRVESIPSLTLCYGGWLGEWLCLHRGGRWVGLTEPTPPRIELGGVCYSPLDAVERRLRNEAAPQLQALVDGLPPGFDRSEASAASVAVNQLAWDEKAGDPRFTGGGAPESREAALAAVDPWLLSEGDIEGRRVLCLAAGGGTHAPLHAMAGADVTVVDLSRRQLDFDQAIAQKLGVSIQRIVGSMDNLSELADGAFDAVVHPVSLCYVREVRPVYTEVARVLRPNGLYISQQKQPGSLQASLLPSEQGYVVESPADEGFALPAAEQASTLRESKTQEFVHPLHALVGGLCQSGFVVEDLVEPLRSDAWAPTGAAEHRARYLPPYLKIKARRRSRPVQSIGLRR